MWHQQITTTSSRECARAARRGNTFPYRTGTRASEAAAFSAEQPKEQSQEPEEQEETSPKKREVKQEVPELLLQIADEKVTAARSDLELALRILGVVKGPYAAVTASFDKITIDGRINLAQFWWEVLRPRDQVIIGSKLRMQRPDGWSLLGAMAVAHTFSDTASSASSLSKGEVRAVLDDLGVEPRQLEECVNGLSDDASPLRAWLLGLPPELLRVRLIVHYSMRVL